MKQKNIFNRNISRLVKTTSDSDRPGEEFTKTLIDEALAELKNPRSAQPRSERNRRMKIKWIKIATCAAILMIVGIVTMNLMPPVFKGSTVAKNEAQGDTAITVQIKSASSPERQDNSKSRLEKAAEKQAERQNGPAVDISFNARPRTLSELSQNAKLDGINESEFFSLHYQVGADRIPARKHDNIYTYTDADRAAGKGVTNVDYSGSSFLVNDSSSAPLDTGFEGLAWEMKHEHTPPMAHGGNTPPNGEPVDAMFFKNYGVNPFVDTEDDHLSTYATDVDTGSFTVCRRYLMGGNLPPNDAVRVEEFVNYFDYEYAAPQEDDFAVYTEAIPWSDWTGRQNSYLVRFGLKAKEISDANRKPAILTFVIDVSGSMNRQNRLGLVKKSLKMLVKQLRPKDKIGIAVYGSKGRKVLDHVNVKKKRKILDAIESLQSGGSTFAEQGIRIGYDMADAAYKEGYINRVILCSDGVANVGKTGHEQILAVIKDKADKGITLSALGFGMGNYNDVLLERLGDKGNGYYAYIDTIDEAKRLFADNLTGSLQVVARDVKIQVDFNPKVVRSYRLIGYENRDVADNKFRDDKEDGGEMGAGHSTTALYELKLWEDKAGDVATMYVRYKDPDTREVTEFNSKIATADFHKDPDQASTGFALAKVVTEFAEVLRESYWAKGRTLNGTLKQAKKLSNKLEDDTDVSELVDLISRARKLIDRKDADD